MFLQKLKAELLWLSEIIVQFCVILGSLYDCIYE